MSWIRLEGVLEKEGHDTCTFLDNGFHKVLNISTHCFGYGKSPLQLQHQMKHEIPGFSIAGKKARILTAARAKETDT